MKRIDLKREYGLPFRMVVAHFASGRSVMVTGDYRTTNDFIVQVNEPALVKATTFSNGKRYFKPEIYVPKAFLWSNKFTLDRLTYGGVQKNCRKCDCFPGGVNFTFDNVELLLALKRRALFCLVERNTPSSPQSNNNVICGFRRIPDEFPDKIRVALYERTAWKG